MVIEEDPEIYNSPIYPLPPPPEIEEDVVMTDTGKTEYDLYNEIYNDSDNDSNDGENKVIPEHILEDRREEERRRYGNPPEYYRYTGELIGQMELIPRAETAEEAAMANRSRYKPRATPLPIPKVTQICKWGNNCQKEFEDGNALFKHIRWTHLEPLPRTCEWDHSQCAGIRRWKQLFERANNQVDAACLEHIRSHCKGYVLKTCLECGKHLTSASGLRSHEAGHRAMNKGQYVQRA